MQPGDDGAPRPERIRDAADLGAHLDHLRRRAARGTGRVRIGLDALAREVDVPRSTVHVYLTGRSVPPAEVLDRIVIALGASPAEQRAWAEAWYRISARPRSDASRRPGRRPDDNVAPAGPTPQQLPPVPHQLPPVPAQLAGRAGVRHDLLDQLTGDGRDAAPLAVVLHGMPGVGKTTLAVAVASAAAPNYPDGQLYVDLGGADAQPRSPSAVLAAFLRALGADPSPMPHDTTELTAQFRSVTAALRLIVVLDNVADESQVEPLLPNSPNCATVVTARAALPGLDVTRRLRVEPLDEDAARELLSSSAGVGRLDGEPAATRRILQACSGLPLALRIAGSRLATLPHLRVVDVADRMTAGDDPLAQLATAHRSVRRGLDTGYLLLPAPARGLLGQLAHLGSGAFAPWLAAAVLDVDVDTGGAVADDLVTAGLMDPASRPPEPPRYRLHDLVRAHAADQCDADPQAQDRVIDHAATLAALANEAVTRRDAKVTAGCDLADGVELAPLDSADPTGWSARELPTLLRCMDLALARDRPATAGALLSNCGLFLVRAGILDEYDAAASRCERHGEPELAARAALAHAEVSMHRSRFSRARDVLDDLVSRSAELPLLLRADVLRQTGFARTFCSDPAGALVALRAALRLSQAAGDVWGEAESDRGLSVVLRDGDGGDALEQAAWHGERALQLAAQVGDWRTHVMTLFGLARLELRRGRPTRAVALADEAYALAQPSADPQSEAWCSVLRSDALREAGLLSAAGDAAEHALRLGRQLRRDDIEAAALASLAQRDRRRGDHDLAESRVRAARGLHERFDSPRELRILEETDATPRGG